MTHKSDVFGPGSNSERRIVTDYTEIKKRVIACKELGLKVVLTSGTYDLFHVGHSRYLESARSKGDILIVGVDSDAKTKKRKGPTRPIVSEEERMEILCHIRHVDLVFLKGEGEERWALIKTVRPDVLVVTQESYSEEEVTALREYCGEIVVLEPQATTSTTAKVRTVFISALTELRAEIEASVKNLLKTLDKVLGGEHEA